MLRRLQDKNTQTDNTDRPQEKDKQTDTQEKDTRIVKQGTIRSARIFIRKSCKFYPYYVLDMHILY